MKWCVIELNSSIANFLRGSSIMQTAALIVAGYLGFATAISVLWIALVVLESGWTRRSRLEANDPRMGGSKT
jgi:hypothetical protein